jgi:hypothetical protein
MIIVGSCPTRPASFKRTRTKWWTKWACKCSSRLTRLSSKWCKRASLKTTSNCFKISSRSRCTAAVWATSKCRNLSSIKGSRSPSSSHHHRTRSTASTELFKCVCFSSSNQFLSNYTIIKTLTGATYRTLSQLCHLDKRLKKASSLRYGSLPSSCLNSRIPRVTALLCGSVCAGHWSLRWASCN